MKYVKKPVKNAEFALTAYCNCSCNGCNCDGGLCNKYCSSNGGGSCNPHVVPI